MVSNGRSSRGRVGLDRSGSAAEALTTAHLRRLIGHCNTYNVSIRITVLHRPNRVDGGLLKSLESYASSVKVTWVREIAHPECTNLVASR